jgi:hypothetical protein
VTNHLQDHPFATISSGGSNLRNTAKEATLLVAPHCNLRRTNYPPSVGVLRVKIYEAIVEADQ